MNNTMSATTVDVKWTVERFETRQPIALGLGEFHPNNACCDKCGQDIKYVVHMVSNRGERMAVGQDCAVTVEGGPALREIRTAQRKAAHAAWLASPEGLAHVAKERAAKAQRAANAAFNAEHHAMHIHGLEAVVASDKASDFERKWADIQLGMWTRGTTTAPLGEADHARFLSAMRSLLGSSHHPAAVGSKIEVVVFFEFLASFENAYGLQLVWNFRDADGRSYVWISKTWPEEIKDKNESRGQAFKMKATIKEKSEFRGQAQTKVLRVKLSPV